MQSLLTIGYEKTKVQDVISEMRRAGIGTLVDVRAVAASRRPGFSKRQFAAALDEAGIGYLHLQKLGTPAEGRHAVRTGKPDTMLRIYEKHLKTPAAREALDELTQLARSGRRLCLLCYERDPHHCHRRRIAQEIEQRTGIKTEHLYVPLAG